MRTFLRRLIATVLVLFLGILLFHGVEDWRGQRAWKAYLQEQEAHGAVFNLARMAPPPVPDAENFAAVPLIADAVAGKGWKGWPTPDVVQDVLSSSDLAGQWKQGRPADLQGIKNAWKVQDLEAALKPYDAVLDGLAEAAKRPRSRFLVDYQNPTDIPALVNFRAVCRVLRLRALVRLQSGQTDLAFEDVMTGLRVIQHLQREPYLISQLLRIAYVNLMLQPIWEGVQDHRWNDAQLATLEQAIGQIDLIGSWKHSLQCERLFTVWSVNELQRQSFGAWFNTPLPPLFQQNGRLARILQRIIFPKGWAYQNCIARDQAMLAVGLDPMDPSKHRIHPEMVRQAIANLSKSQRNPYSYIGVGDIRALIAQTPRVAQAQVGLDEARIAAGLERFHLAKGHYPERLDQLAPMFLPNPPMDLVTGEPYHYRLQAGGSYLLYSVGWDQKDDGGTPSSFQNGPQGPGTAKGDWLWSSSSLIHQ